MRDHIFLGFFLYNIRVEKDFRGTWWFYFSNFTKFAPLGRKSGNDGFGLSFYGGKPGRPPRAHVAVRFVGVEYRTRRNGALPLMDEMPGGQRLAGEERSGAPHFPGAHWPLPRPAPARYDCDGDCNLGNYTTHH